MNFGNGVAEIQQKYEKEREKGKILNFGNHITKVKFLELEVVQANAKVERVFTKKFDDVLSSQKTFSDKTELGYTGESSSTVNISKEVKFVKAKEPIVVDSTVEKANVEKKKNVTDQRVLNKPHNQSMVKFEARAKSLPRL